jgi:hypothetical protein
MGRPRKEIGLDSIPKTAEVDLDTFREYVTMHAHAAYQQHDPDGEFVRAVVSFVCNEIIDQELVLVHEEAWKDVTYREPAA